MKQCSSCKSTKESDQFYANKATLDGKSSWCKACTKQNGIDRYKAGYVHKKKKMATKEGHKFCSKCIIEKPFNEFSPNPKAKSGLHSWCLECEKAYDKEYSNKRIKELYANDPHFKWVAQSRQDMRNLLYRSGLLADSFAIDFEKFFGCNIATFKAYFESQFTEGMNWSNYGKGKDKWSIDHIKALDHFEPNSKEVNHYTNLQPMWYSDNSRKGNKIFD